MGEEREEINERKNLISQSGIREKRVTFDF
jgi:hypothetical protein